MSRMDQVFKAYDVRGIVPDQLDAAMCRAIGRAMARFAGAPEILVARDMRESGVALSGAFSDGVRSEGVDVTDLGHGVDRLLVLRLGPSRRARRHVHGLAQSGAVQRHQAVLVRARVRSVWTPAWSRSRPPPRSCSTSRPAPSRAHGASSTCSTPGRTTWSRSSTSPHSRPLTVVADTANGMGGLVVPIVFERLPF